MQSLTRINSFYRLADGVHTVFLANAEGILHDIVDVARWAASPATRFTCRAPSRSSRTRGRRPSTRMSARC